MVLALLLHDHVQAFGHGPFLLRVARGRGAGARPAQVGVGEAVKDAADQSHPARPDLKNLHKGRSRAAVRVRVAAVELGLDVRGDVDPVDDELPHEAGDVDADQPTIWAGLDSGTAGPASHVPACWVPAATRRKVDV